MRNDTNAIEESDKTVFGQRNNILLRELDFIVLFISSEIELQLYKKKYG